MQRILLRGHIITRHHFGHVTSLLLKPTILDLSFSHFSESLVSRELGLDADGIQRQIDQNGQYVSINRKPSSMCYIAAYFGVVYQL